MASDLIPPPPPTLLIVDDDEAVLAVLNRLLRTEPVRVLTLLDSTQAMAVVEAEHVDILLSDMDMPSLGGLELLARVRRAYPEVVRILLTGRASLGAALHAINEGEVFRFLTKPWENDELRAVIRQAVVRLSEMRRHGDVAHAAERRERLLSALEREHPGITDVARADGAYRLDRQGIAALVAELPIPALRALWDP